MPGISGGLTLGQVGGGGVLESTIGVWTGYLNVVTAGVYTFNDLTDDNCEFSIDGNFLLTASWVGNTLPQRENASAFLTPGLHVFKDLYFNGDGTAGELVSYTGPDTNNVTNFPVIGGATSLNSPGFISAGVLNLNSTIASTSSLTIGGATAGQVNIPNAQPYTGPTFLSAGITNVGNSGSLGTGPNAVLNITGGSLESDASVNIANPLNLVSSTVVLSGQSNVTLSGNGTLTGLNTLVLANVGQANITGNLSGTGSLVIDQPPGQVQFNTQLGTTEVSFSGQSTFTGGVTLNGSILQMVIAGSTTGLGPTSGPFGTGTLTLVAGTVVSDAHGENIANPIALDGNIILAPSSFGGSSSANSKLTLSGAVTLATNSSLTVQSGAVDTISGSIGDGGNGFGLTMGGLGTLTLSGTTNTFSGGVTLNAGSLATAFGTLVLGNNSVLGTGSFTMANGNVLALTPMTIANPLAFANGPLTTSTENISFSGTNAITFANAAINTIQGTANLIIDTTTTFNEVLTGDGGLQLFSGTSSLFLQQANAFTGSTTVNQGTLVLNQNGTLNSVFVQVNVGATLIEDNTGINLGTTGSSTRLNNLGGGLNLDGGTYEVIGGAGGTTENLGFNGLFLQSGNSTILTNSTAGSVTITTGNLYRFTGATVNYQTVGSQIMGSANNQFQVGTFGSSFSISGAGEINNVFPYAVVTDGTAFNGGFNLATLGGNGIQALPSGSYATSLTGNPATDSTANLLVTTATSPISLAASDTINSMLLVGNGITVTGITGTSLTVGSGMVASTGSTGSTDTISVPGLAFGAIEGVVYTNTGLDSIKSKITGTGGVTFSGNGNLTLATANSFSDSAPGSINQSLQTIQINPQLASVGQTIGTFTLNFNGVTTANIAYNPVGSIFQQNIQTALQNLSTIGAGNIVVTSNVSTTPGLFTLTFTGGLAGAVLPQIVVAGTSLGGGTSGSTLIPGTAISLPSRSPKRASARQR